MGGRQQCRGWLPTCQRRITILRPLLPVIPAMLVQQLIGERENHAKAKRLRPRRKVPMPCRARRIERPARQADRSEEHTSELQSLMRISYAVFCLKKKTQNSH